MQRILFVTLSRPFAPQKPRISSQKWLSGNDLAAFAAAGTDAHRVTTAPDGWIERFGGDILISYKSDSALEILRTVLQTWSTETGYSARRIFGKFLPRQNADRIAPVLLDGDATLPLTTVVQENGVRFGLDF